jgi:hypothetical protein
MRESEKLKQFAEKWISAEDRVGITGVGNWEQHINSLRRKVEELEAEIQQFVDISGCSNRARAKDHFRTLMHSKKIQHDLTLVREGFHKISATWLDGVAKRGSILAEAPLAYSRAMLEHASLMPRIILLHEQCSKLENGEEILDQFEGYYLTMGRKQFGNLLFKFVEEIVEQEEEQEEEQKVKVERGASTIEMQRSLRAAKADNYGVGGVLEEVSWED